MSYHGGAVPVSLPLEGYQFIQRVALEDKRCSYELAARLELTLYTEQIRGPLAGEQRIGASVYPPQQGFRLRWRRATSIVLSVPPANLGYYLSMTVTE